MSAGDKVNEGGAPDALPAPQSITVGTVLGQWRLVETIGQGGMGTVYRAQHIAIGRIAAIKLLEPYQSGHSAAARRFLDEARVLAQIKHPGVIEIYDYAVHDSGAAYIVMELLEGVPLDKLVQQRGRLTEQEAIAIATSIADALAAAHALGIVHRDLKPSNVFLARDPAAPGGRRIKVLDFGIAKLSTEEAGLSLTLAHVVMGSPGYMSPEQIQSARDVDGRTDQYALGCVLFHMLSGRPPFEGDGAFSTMMAHVRDVPPALSSLVPVSQRLERIVDRLLAKQPADRFESMEEVSRALSAIADRTAAEPAPLDTLLDFSGSPAATTLTLIVDPVVDLRLPAPLDALMPALPERLRNDAPLIDTFLRLIAASYQAISEGTLRLIRPSVPGAAGFDFFALLMSGEASTEVRTMTFVEHALPLERHLQSLRGDTKKVVIVLSDWFELGRGVREKILDYRTRFDALVVPIYLGEMRKAQRANQLDTLFTERLADFQAVPDLYATTSTPGDPTRFFGMRHVLDDLIAELEVAQRVVVIHGLPGSGKSSLARMADYGMTTTRFVHVACSGVAPAALPGRIASALGRPGDGLEALQTAARATVSTVGGPRIVLVLDDAELVPVPSEADAWLTVGADPIDPSVRALLDTLVELAADKLMSTVATTVRGFALGRATHKGERNPFVKAIRTLHVPPLERRAVIQMVRDLGAQMNVTASDRVVDGCAELSGGHVDVVRRLCSGMLQRHRRDEPQHALRAVELTRRDLRAAAGDLAALPSTFESVLPWLSVPERRVLHGIAVKPPRDVADLATDRLRLQEASDALEELRDMGLVRRVDSREQLTIPLLASWARRHLRDPARTIPSWLRWLQ